MALLSRTAPYVLVVAVMCAGFFVDMPHPYHGRKPAPIDAASLARFPPFPANLTGPYEKNDLLAKHAVRLLEGQVHGAESVAVAPDGTLLMLDKYAWLHRARQQEPRAAEAAVEYTLLGAAQGVEPLYIGPGRPLGYHVVENGTALVVCDSVKGLLWVHLKTGAITVLANRAHTTSGPQLGATSRGGAINYANDLDVVSGEDAISEVYFSSSTAGTVSLHAAGFYDTMRSFLLNMCCGDHTGRLLRFSPSTGKTQELVSGLWYANGVEVSHDKESVLVVETMGFRVVQYWLKGEMRGRTTTLIDSLPGFPDGISKSSDGNYWCACILCNRDGCICL